VTFPPKTVPVENGRSRFICKSGLEMLCFWHKHRCKYGRVKPATNAKYWEAKRKGNVQRDKNNIKKLRILGWKILVVWECWTKDRDRLKGRLKSFLNE
jgi:DNA mismatch endonuclease, patch repair protein